MSLFDKLPTFLTKAGEWIDELGRKVITGVSKVVVGAGEFGVEKVLKPIGAELAKEGVLGYVKPFREAVGVKPEERRVDRLVAASEKAMKGDTEELGKLTGETALRLLPVAKVSKVGQVTKEVERGFVTSVKEELPQIKAAGQYIPRSTDELAIKAKNLIKDDFATAEKLAITGTDENAVATASELIKHYADTAAKIEDVATKNSLYDKAAEVANTIAEKLTEQGRAVQAASILGRLTPEGQVRFAAREIQKYNEVAKITQKIPELTGEQTAYIVNEMKTLNGMAEGTEKAMKFQQLQDYVSKLVPTPLTKKMIAVWKAGLLTGMKTTGVNIFSNLSHAVTEVVKDAPAEVADRIISLFTGTRTKAFTVRGLFAGAKEGVARGWQYLKTGFDERNIGTKLDYTKVNFGEGKLAKGLQAYTDSVFRLLGAEDQPFYYAAKLRSFYEQAKVEAINKGLKGKEAQEFINNLIKNPTEKMIQYGSADAQMAVFQNKTLLGKAATAIQKNVPGGEVIVPFGRTPSAVATQIFNYTPAGIVSEVVKQMTKTGFDQKRLSEAIGRGLTGTAVLGLGAYFFKKGLVTTSRPAGEREQKLWEVEGKQPNSIKIGGKWRQISVLGPLGNVLLVGGSLQKAFNDTGSPTGAIAQGLADTARAFTQQTFLTGVSNFMDAITDPARNATYVAGYTLASVIPTIISDIARATDTKERRATAEKWSQELLNRFFLRIPGARETLEPQVTVLGKEKETENPLEIMIDPTRPISIGESSVIEELRRLWDIGQEVSPTLLGDKNGYPGLTPEQNTELWKKAGEITNEKLTNLFYRPEYQKLSDDEKGKLVNSFVDKSKLYARVATVLEITEGMIGQELLQKLSELKKSGLMTAEVFKEYQGLR